MKARFTRHTNEGKDLSDVERRHLLQGEQYTLSREQADQKQMSTAVMTEHIYYCMYMCVFVHTYTPSQYSRLMCGETLPDIPFSTKTGLLSKYKFIIPVVPLVITWWDAICELESKKDSHCVLSNHSVAPYQRDPVAYMQRKHPSDSVNSRRSDNRGHYHPLLRENINI